MKAHNDSKLIIKYIIKKEMVIILKFGPCEV
jgi:hypothetical protein